MNRIDDIGRVLIPRKIRNPLGWEKGNTVAIEPDVDKKSLTVTLANGDAENLNLIDDLRRIQIPKAVLDLLGWEYASTLKHIINENDNSITMVIAA